MREKRSILCTQKVFWKTFYAVESLCVTAIGAKKRNPSLAELTQASQH